MISVGESTGALDSMLSKIADFYEEEVDVAVGNLTSLLDLPDDVFRHCDRRGGHLHVPPDLPDGQCGRLIFPSRGYSGWIWMEPLQP